uniref:Uncharacterized protein n=1 Tax=Avena sativa TaxID=4498 RepID=A0ACD5UI64_AVESA
MALPTRGRHLLVILAAAMAIPAGAADGVDVTGGFLTSDCDRDPQWLSTANSTAFRASLAPLLAFLPSAAAPTGFASLSSADERAFARGLCFGESPAPKDCGECLSISVDRIDACNGSRRARFWTAGCFLAYADTNASSAHEDEWFSRTFDPDGGFSNYYPEFYDVNQIDNLVQSLAPRAANGSSTGGRMVATANATAQANSTVRALAQCPGNVTPAECERCLEKSAQNWPEFLWVPGHAHDRVQLAGVFTVLRYRCYLRLEISAPMLPVAMGKGERLRKKMWDNLAVVVVVAVAILS